MCSQVEVLNHLDFTQSVIGKMNENPKQNWDVLFFQFDRGHLAEPFWRSVVNTSRSGGNVRVAVDDFSRHWVNGKSFDDHSDFYSKKMMEHKLELASELQDADVDFRYLSKVGRLWQNHPIWKRVHIKTVINDEEVWMGSANLADECTSWVDSMVHIKSANLAEQARQIYDLVYSEQTGPDLCLTFDGGKLLFDSGYRFGKSGIYDHAREMIDRATDKVRLISPHIPDGSIVRCLQNAIKRDVDVAIVTSDPQRRLESTIEKYRLPTPIGNIPVLYNPDQRVHTKALLVKGYEGNQVLIGSHNLTSKSNYLRAQELSVFFNNNEQFEVIEKWATDTLGC